MRYVILVAILLLVSGCAVRQDRDIVRVYRNDSYEFDRNGWFISDIAFGFKKGMFPKDLDDIQD